MASSGEKHTVKKYKGFGTASIHCGMEFDPHTGAVMTPISLSTTFAQKSPGVKYPAEYEYSRSGNPTRDAMEENLAGLENADAAISFASGLAATAGIIHCLEPNSHVIVTDDVYGGTQRFFRRIATQYGHTFSFVDFTKEGALEEAFQENTRLVWAESPTNPTLKICDIAAVSEIAHRHGALCCVDNTFMTPYYQQPLVLGADIVMHSATKYLNGHSDVVMGIVATSNPDMIEKLRFNQNAVGAVPSPFDCYMMMRGLKTLHLRMRAHGANAGVIAKLLESHDKVDRVVYPGLESHPQHEIAKKQCHGFGGMVTFFIKGGLDGAKAFLENLKVFTLAESLGGVESLAEHPVIMTHASVPAEHRAVLGIDDSLIRLSVGTEDIEDLVQDISNALDAVQL